MKMLSHIFAVVTSLSLVMGCANAPTQEMSDARQAIRAAQEAQASRYAQARMESAEELLRKAEQAIEEGRYDSARGAAVAAKKAAIEARSQALAKDER